MTAPPRAATPVTPVTSTASGSLRLATMQTTPENGTPR